jgi:translation initiation factor IF-3
MPLETALGLARAEGLDLVEISPMANPPVCKIMDYGKFKYEEKKKASEAKKKQVVVHLKEVKLRPKTEEHDYEFKVRNIKRFLEEGNNAKVTIVFRGREITHKELGSAILDDVNKDLKDVAVVEQMPRMEGRQMFMILSPNPKVAQRAREQARQQAEAAAKAEAAAVKKLEGSKGDGGKPDQGERQEAGPQAALAEFAPPAAQPQVGLSAEASASAGTK